MIGGDFNARVNAASVGAGDENRPAAAAISASHADAFLAFLDAGGLGSVVGSRGVGSPAAAPSNIGTTFMYDHCSAPGKSAGSSVVYY